MTLAADRHRVTLNLNPQELAMLRRLANDDNRTLSNMARTAIKQSYIARYGDQLPAVEENA